MIEYLKSGLSISSYIGCNLNCKYCVISSFYDNTNKIKRLTSPNNLINDLLKHKYFNPNVPLMIENKTEAFYRDIKDDTYTILKLLKEHKINNPKILITKLPIDFKNYEAFDQNNIFLFTTYSNMPKDIEKTSNYYNLNKIIQTNNKIKKYTDAKIIHYWRPIIKNINSDKIQLYNVIQKVYNTFDCSIVSGIRLTPSLKTLLEKYGADFSDWNQDINHKFLSSDIYNEIIKIKNQLNPSYNIFRKTSCAMSYLLKQPDFNYNFINKSNICLNCINKPLCNSFNISIDTKEIDKLLKKLNINFKYTINKDNILEIYGDLNQEDVSCIKHTTRLQIKVNNIIQSDSEVIYNQRNISHIKTM